MEIVKYVFPVNYYQVQLESNEDGSINQQFESGRESGQGFKMTEIDTMFGNTTTVKYVFEIQTSELVVLSCNEFTKGEKEKKYHDGYPYIIFPNTFLSKAKWEYMHGDDRKVRCESGMVKKKFDGELRNILVVSRDVQLLDLKEKGGIRWKEYYVEGKGLVKRTESLY